MDVRTIIQGRKAKRAVWRWLVLTCATSYNLEQHLRLESKADQYFSGRFDSGKSLSESPPALKLNNFSFEFEGPVHLQTVPARSSLINFNSCAGCAFILRCCFIISLAEGNCPKGIVPSHSVQR